MSVYSIYCIIILILMSESKESLPDRKLQQNYKSGLYTEADISDLPQNIQIALQLLTNEDLEAINEAALPDTEIYYGLIEYFQSSWDKCNWVDELPGSIEYDAFTWKSSNNIIKNGHNAWCEIAETFDPFTMDNIDESAPDELYIEIQNLLDNGLQSIARFKHQAWTEYGIIWDDTFVTQLGLQNDDELFSEFDTQLDNLLNTETYKNRVIKKNELINENELINASPNAIGSKKLDSTETECKIRNPIMLMTPYFNSVSEVWGNIFGNSELYDSKICASINWGIQICSSDESEICLGGGFGFLICANGKGFIFKESKLDINNDINTFTDTSSRLTIEMSLYNNIENAIDGKLTKDISDFMEENQWLTQPR
eukprot:732161_1